MDFPFLDDVGGLIGQGTSAAFAMLHVVDFRMVGLVGHLECMVLCAGFEPALFHTGSSARGS